MRQRITETNEGIQNELTVEVFDDFAKRMRDKGWNGVKDFLDAGVTEGRILEIGPGPGYIGLEWLKNAPNATLTGLEISPAMIRVAEKNAEEYRLSNRVEYIEGNCMAMPFTNNSFDAVFSNGSLHEWENVLSAFDEVHRVLKPGGIFCISDMRRDVNFFTKWFIYFLTKPAAIRPGMLTSLNAAYTVNELAQLVKQTDFRDVTLRKEFFGLFISCRK